MAASARYRPVQPRRRPAEDRVALPERSLGYSLSSFADDAYSEAADRPIRRACRERTYLPQVGAKSRPPRGAVHRHALQEGIAIVVERYDRQRKGNDIIRVHQEDVCQALGIMPTKKYQNEGGPSAFDIVQLLRTYSTDREADLETFIDALGFNWIIAGTDAHAKNYSLLLSGRRIRLAPLYDVASILPYDDFDFQKMKLAMKVGGEYKLSLIGLRQWQKFARQMRIDTDALVERLAAMAERLPDEVNAARAGARSEGLDAPIIERLAKELIERANACRKSLAAA
jgi:serine/threonine-protein kinase HipA